MSVIKHKTEIFLKCLISEWFCVDEVKLLRNFTRRDVVPSYGSLSFQTEILARPIFTYKSFLKFHHEASLQRQWKRLKFNFHLFIQCESFSLTSMNDQKANYFCLNQIS